jgi:NAD(P)-dependent dehydrogenase (short-subunit alcohol dehydrogenase family)
LHGKLTIARFPGFWQSPFSGMKRAPSMAPTVFIAAVSSDIGLALARLYRARGSRVIGTYRDSTRVAVLRDDAGVTLLPCDVTDPASIRAAAAQLAEPWEVFISAVGQLAPVGNFLTAEAEAMGNAMVLNGSGQLLLLRALWPHRRPGQVARVAFLVGGAINRAFAGYSAYSLGKLTLVKACELLHDEEPGIHAVAIGTGWVATRIHAQTLAAGEAAGANLHRTRDFMASGAAGTSMEDILACLDWCFAQPREVTGGRNFSVVHDAWRDGGAALAARLAAEPDTFMLRRQGNSA